MLFRSLKRSGFDVTPELILEGIKDVIADKELKLTEQQAREVIMAYQNELRTKREAERAQQAEENKKKGEAFLTQNKSKQGVKTHNVTLPDGTKAELQYKILKEGSGNSPGSNDVVTVNYRGTLIDGKEFDSSAKTGQPAKFPVGHVIRGWTEALKMMKPGSKWELYIPSSLAYGDFGQGQVIPPGATLIFDVELLSSEAPAPPTPPAPLTSDIIRVPSADELKKGAKVEILKAEDVEKQLKASAATNKPAATNK